MDTIKSVVGLGEKKEETGDGVTNGEKVEDSSPADAAAPVTGEEESSKEEAPATTTTTENMNSTEEETKPENTTEAAPESKDSPPADIPAASEDKAVKPDTPSPDDASKDETKTKRSSTGWLKSANPFAKRKSVDKTLDEKPQAQATGAATHDKPPQLPPNQLGDDVPLGVTSDLADADAGAPGATTTTTTTTESKSNGKSPQTQEQENESVANANNNIGAPPADQMNRYEASHPSPQSLRGSRGSVAFPRPENPDASKKSSGRIPTAGGKAVGAGAKEDAGSLSTAALRGSRGSVAFPRGEENVRTHPVNPSRVPTAGGKAVGAAGTSSGKEEGAASQQQPSSNTAALRGSRGSVAFSRDQDLGKSSSATNPGRVPTAGGRVVGAAQTERRKSRTVSAEDLPKVDRQGSPDPVTEMNTLQNATGPNKSNGEGSSKMAFAEEEEGVAEPGVEGEGQGVGKSEAAVAPEAPDTNAAGPEAVGKSDAAVAPEAPAETGVASEAPKTTTIVGEQTDISTGANASGGKSGGGGALEAGKEKLKEVKQRRGSLVDRIFKRGGDKK